MTSKGETLSYLASWSEMPLGGFDGSPQATISTLSYVRTQASVERPVIFVFNGGPGASSITLNYGLFGPESRVIEGVKPFVEPSDTRQDGTVLPTKFVPNRDTLLDVADLVMIDPVGTGFSRELVPGGGQYYWSISGDIESFQKVIRKWLSDHGRTGSPIYIAGESYGGYRAGYLASALADLDIRGLILLSPGIDLNGLSGGDLTLATALPTMAVAAVYHGRVPARSRSFEQIHREAQSFVRDEYVPALHQGSELPAAERARLAKRMSALIGLPADKIVAANLRVDTQTFLENLVPGNVIGQLDNRAMGPLPENRDGARFAEAEDPSFGLQGGMVRYSKPVSDHLREMGVKSDTDYVAVTLDVNFRWDWRSRSPSWFENQGLNAASAYTNFMARRPKARLLVTTGYFDLAVPIDAPRHTLAHANVPFDRVTFKTYESGHTTSDDPKARLDLIRDIRAFVAKSD
ncbi:S10 family serine carboxypeptidase-like protein [Sphingopyxis terrae]|uniref:S10 family serine carboxypeptidase-like protein n=1 Tax=Sphingopyxis terrae TaxID=33052 RepID=UPI002A0F68AA|nr:hypothetical protein [Sphingopyxis terrae]MDX8356491.1 hypothetical protein [Sphingopyxis terrae]